MQISKGRSVEKIVEDQIHQWQMAGKGKKKTRAGISVITVSRQPGSGGTEIAKSLAETLGFSIFDREIIHQMAESAKTSTHMLETLDEKGLNVLEEMIATLVDERHLWPDQYLKHLMKVIGTISEHGNAIIVGRGANFILPDRESLRLRFVAPLDQRIKWVMKEHDISEDEAKRLIFQADSDRRAFARKYFYTSIDDPTHYDLIINTGKVSQDQVIAAIRGVVECHCP